MAQIYISLGSNIERHQHITAGLDALEQAFSTIQISSVYESEAVGFAGSHFYNLVAAASTSMSAEQVVQVLKQIEDNNGRVRGGKKFSPRTLDLDLLLYDDLVCEQPVQLPRNEILFNAFVLLPLAEIAADSIHPIKQVNYATLWQQYDKSQQNLWPVEFKWTSKLS
ncbi:2-amino-4-hydroxy-6-hydroxymethyldihydropteridine diphosphokinase [Neptunicella sp. SCSIO 80796]|uniref:2-amino-4-hydroxy-6- hydroxymethyldihydropteridine diphosphokinase n=1 Tax=Neptunicella plasticusilytica TaxID=3117012 RepID=UPI003A4D50FB